MTCEELLKALNEYVDGNESVAECEAFAAHLAECNPCQIVVDNIRQSIALYKNGRPFELPQPLQSRLDTCLRAAWQKKFAGG